MHTFDCLASSESFANVYQEDDCSISDGVEWRRFKLVCYRHFGESFFPDASIPLLLVTFSHWDGIIIPISCRVLIPLLAAAERRACFKGTT